MTALFPAAGHSREDQIAARKLGRRILNVVHSALVAHHAGAQALRLDVRVSRRARVGPCIILHRVAGERNALASGDWLPWSWPLSVFTKEDAAYLQGGQLPEIVRPCVRAWSKLLRAPSLDPRVTV